MISWFRSSFGFSSRRRELLEGLRRAIKEQRRAGCAAVCLDGSFVTTKQEPGDYDACWDIEGVDAGILDPVLLDFSNARAAQKRKYQGEFFPAQMPEGASGKLFVEFFQVDKETGLPKGIVAMRLRRAEA